MKKAPTLPYPIRMHFTLSHCAAHTPVAAITHTGDIKLKYPCICKTANTTRHTRKQCSYKFNNSYIIQPHDVRDSKIGISIEGGVLVLISLVLLQRNELAHLLLQPPVKNNQSGGYQSWNPREAQIRHGATVDRSRR